MPMIGSNLMCEADQVQAPTTQVEGEMLLGGHAALVDAIIGFGQTRQSQQSGGESLIGGGMLGCGGLGVLLYTIGSRVSWPDHLGLATLD